MATKEDFERYGKWAVMYNPDRNIDRRKCTRKVPMKVLNLGMPRTGTQSMQEALEILGYPTYLFASIFENCRDADMWIQAFEAKYKGIGKFDQKEFDQLLGHVSATTDAPTICFWRELVDYYPEAKVILVERDEDKWFQSFSAVLEGLLHPIGFHVLRWTDPYVHGRIISVIEWWIMALLGSTDLKTAKSKARLAYQKHYSEIRKTVPKERLLEYTLGSGWEPLCEFLDVDVPKDKDFPFRNESSVLNRAFGAYFRMVWIHTLRNLSVVICIGVAIGAIITQVAKG